MSFSSDVKNEIIKHDDSTKRMRIATLLGMLCFGARISVANGEYHLKFSTENPKIARFLYSLIKNDCEIKATLSVFRGKKAVLYSVTLDDSLEIGDLFHTVGLLRRDEELEDFSAFRIIQKTVSDTSEKKAFVQGAFLAAGSIIAPQKNCHLEFVTSHQRLSEQMQKLLETFGVSPKISVRKSNFVLYFKSSSDVADILTIFGAYDCLMEYHNIKIMKDVRNSINRKMNCDTANMTKTLDAAFKQAEAIEKLKKLGILDKMNDSLREIANLRLQYKELGLKELGAMMNPPLGKSGVNHRLRKLIEEAEKY